MNAAQSQVVADPQWLNKAASDNILAPSIH